MRAAKLCVTVAAPTMAELRRRRDEVANADLVEVRVDTVRDPSAEGALAGRNVPVIFTCRPKWEGGHFTGSEEERRRLLNEAQRLGAEYIDVEWKAGFTELLEARQGQGVVLSFHDFAGVPSDLEARARAMSTTGAEVIKLAIMATRLSDCLTLWRIPRPKKSRMALVALGDAGIASRILAARFGSCWTYAGDGVAPGQLPASRLRDEFSFDAQRPTSKIYGVVGQPIMHSISPAMHNAAFRALGLDAVYLPLAAADFDDFLRFADALGIVGVSVTAPFKLAAFERTPIVDAMSEQVRSVNTLKRTGGRWKGRNTDVAGFLAPLQATLAVKGLRATVMGAGGAARAAAVALGAAGAHVAIAARRRERAEAVQLLTGAAVSDWPPAAGSWDVLVNATPVGTAPNESDSPLPGGPFTGELVYDLVYNPAETRLVREARAAGCRTIGGLDMLVEQARAQFAWWTRKEAPARVMRDAAIRALDSRAERSVAAL